MFFCFPPLLPFPLHTVTVTDDDDYVGYSFFFPLLFLTALSPAFLAPAVALVYY